MNEYVQKKLQQLLMRYKQNLPKKITTIQTQWEDLQDHWESQKAETLHRDVHSLCGSAGTYGYSELAKIARQAEICLKNTLNSEGSIRKDDKKAINFYLNRLSAAALLEPLSESTRVDIEQSCKEKVVYIVEEDKNLFNLLNVTLTNMGYQPYRLQDTITLRTAVKEISPVAIVINAKYLDKESIQFLNQRERNNLNVSLFCLVSGVDLLPRLLAVRAGCDAFFQIPLDINYFTRVFHSKCDIPSESYRILVVDDSETLAEYYTLILNQSGMIAKAVTNPLQLLNEIKSFQPDLLVMDIYMPECTGLELAAVLRQEKHYTKIPIIFLSTEEDRNKQLFALSMGGDDFLCKPVSPQHLISAIRSRARRASMLNYYMVTDSLTGVLNHSSALKQLEIEIARAMQKNTSLTVSMIDIGHFKKINDCYGHPVGDKVIKQLANLFLIYLRTQDIIGRYGGEEFVLILPGTNANDGKKVCNDLRVLFSQQVFKELEYEFSVTFSAGISCLKGEKEAVRVIKEADEALYRAKQKGRNRVVVFDE